jgi:hypothetical protein
VCGIWSGQVPYLAGPEDAGLDGGPLHLAAWAQVSLPLSFIFMPGFSGYTNLSLEDHITVPILSNASIAF